MTRLPRYWRQVWWFTVGWAFAGLGYRWVDWFIPWAATFVLFALAIVLLLLADES